MYKFTKRLAYHYSKERLIFFICYRRKPSDFTSRCLRDALKKRGFKVFRDKESLTWGKWQLQLIEAICNSRYFLVIIEHETFLNPSKTFITEIETAINNNCEIIPILVGGFKFSPENNESHPLLDVLAEYQALEIPDSGYIDSKVDELCKKLKQVHPNRVIFTGLLNTARNILMTQY